MEKLFGTIKRIGNKRVIVLRYTDLELSARIVKFLHSRGYRFGNDYTVIEYFGKKNVHTSKIEAIICDEDILLIMAIKQKRISEKALAKAKQLESKFYNLP